MLYHITNQVKAKWMDVHTNLSILKNLIYLIRLNRLKLVDRNLCCHVKIKKIAINKQFINGKKNHTHVLNVIKLCKTATNNIITKNANKIARKRNTFLATQRKTAYTVVTLYAYIFFKSFSETHELKSFLYPFHLTKACFFL